MQYTVHIYARARGYSLALLLILLQIVRWFVEESGGDLEVMCSNQGKHKRRTALDYVLQSIDPEEEPSASSEKYKVTITEYKNKNYRTV